MKKYLLIGASAFVLGAGSMAYVSQQALATAQPRAKTYRMLGLFGDVPEHGRKPVRDRGR
jgi:carboxyl-terminal processing protease